MADRRRIAYCARSRLQLAFHRELHWRLSMTNERDVAYLDQLGLLGQRLLNPGDYEGGRWEEPYDPSA